MPFPSSSVIAVTSVRRLPVGIGKYAHFPSSMLPTPRCVPAQSLFVGSTDNPIALTLSRYKLRCPPSIRPIPTDVEAQTDPSGPAARAPTSAFTSPLLRVNVVIFSSQKRFRPFWVPTQMLCSRSSSKHHTNAVDKPLASENLSMFGTLYDVARSRAKPCPRVPIHVFPLLSRSTVWTSLEARPAEHPHYICALCCPVRASHPNDSVCVFAQPKLAVSHFDEGQDVRRCCSCSTI